MSFRTCISALAASALTALATPATAYPVDCAILLCLGGGWPASAECAQARAVFIARITPWPVEPPLQIWNCPLQAAARRETPVERIFDIAFRLVTVPPVSPPALPAAAPLPDSVPMPVANQADIDISDPVYDFVRSIRVYQTEYRRHENSDHDCNVWSTVRRGSYGKQGDYHWRSSSIVSGLSTPCFNVYWVLRDWPRHNTGGLNVGWRGEERSGGLGHPCRLER